MMADQSDDARLALEDDMRKASDSFLDRVERMHALEERKRQMPADEIEGLAREIEGLAAEVLGWAREQSRLAETAADAQYDHLPSIAALPPRSLPEILGDWRAAERRMQSVEAGSDDYESARADAHRLRDEYARAYSRQTRDDVPR
jgi:cell division septum initiation protein DivIVA